MGGVDVGGGGGKHVRAINAELNLIPFIDLLFVTVAFLLITAVWVTNSRLNANAMVPGEANAEPPVPDRSKVLNVIDGPNDFTLAWKSNDDVISEVRLPKPNDAGDPIRYSDLASR